MTGAAPDFRALAERGPVHFVGVGGAGMAPLAELAHRSGARVTGCDAAPGRAAAALARLGVPVSVGHDPAHVRGQAALVVTSAVPDDHPELEAARARGVPVIKRAAALGQWIRGGRVAAVAGTHGKTTTAALATHALAGAGLDPTGVVGGEVREWGGNLRAGSSDLFVVEADEYDRSFLEISPRVAVVTSVEADHLDVYGDLDGVRSSFSEFVARLRPDGVLWVCGDDAGAARLAVEAGGRARSYGFGAGAQLRAVRVERSSAGAEMTVLEDGRDRGRLRAPMPGPHNALNALAAAAIARSLGASWDAILPALATFGGVSRRWEVVGQAAGALVVDDYAHHPTEVAAALATARLASPEGRLVAVFQPHLYSRTRDFAAEFARALSAADAVWVADVYPAREAPIEGVTGRLIAESPALADARARYHADVATLAEAVAASLEPGDACVTMGAGSIERTGPEILAALRRRDAAEALAP